MIKKVLVISYSQSGQLSEVLDSITSEIALSDTVLITHHIIRPVKPYPYPWDLITFMDTFPESVHLVPCEIEPIADNNEYDLIILGYQVWFLSPSIPTTAFLKSPYAKEKLKNKPVVTVIACRNMWVMAAQKTQRLLSEIGAKLVDNIVLVDQGASYATFITTPRWMFTGKKDAFLGVFPKAGVSAEDITNAKRFGKAILTALLNNQEHRTMCHGLKACYVDEKLIASEKIATKSFTIWGKLIRRFGAPGAIARRPLILLYLIFLCLIIVTVVPINMLIQTLLRKLNPQKIQILKHRYEQPSGNEENRMEEFL